jgi:hypothetical protein
MSTTVIVEPLTRRKGLLLGIFSVAVLGGCAYSYDLPATDRGLKYLRARAL